jgi:hypothetical protein
MSTEYSANAAYGLFVESEIIERMITTFSQRVEKQERFDQKTGKNLGKVEVIVEPYHQALVIDGEKFGYGEECNDRLEAGLDLLAKSIHPKFSCFRCQEQDGTVYAYVFGLGINDTDHKVTVKLMTLMDKHAAKMLHALNELLVRGTTFTVKPTVTAILEVC